MISQPTIIIATLIKHNSAHRWRKINFSQDEVSFQAWEQWINRCLGSSQGLLNNPCMGISRQNGLVFNTHQSTLLTVTTKSNRCNGNLFLSYRRGIIWITYWAVLSIWSSQDLASIPIGLEASPQWPRKRLKSEMKVRPRSLYSENRMAIQDNSTDKIKS